MFSPYDLIVVPAKHAKPDREHYIMSSKGVVHVKPGEPTEFLSLPDWVREKAQFRAISALPFFKYAIPRKAFSLWRASVRFNKYRKQHSKLAASLFPWKPAFAAAMRELAATLDKIATLPFLDLTQARFTVPSFLEAQSTARSDAMKLLEREINSIHVVVERVCDDVVARSHQRNSEDADPYGDSAMVKARDAKTKSMAALRAEAEAKAAALRSATEEEAKLGPFVRLVDYLLVETITSTFVSELHRLHKELVEPDSRRLGTGMFGTTLLFDVENGTVFEPCAADLTAVFETVVVDGIKALSSSSRVLYSRPFRHLVNGLPTASGSVGVFGAPTVGTLLAQSVPFATVRRHILDKFTTDFAAAQEYSHVFDPVRPIFDYQLTTDWEDYRARDHTPASLQRDLARLKGWDAQLDRMRSQHVQGCLFIDSKRLRSELSPITANANDRIKAIAQAMAREQCRASRDAFDARVKALEARPTALNKFFAHVSYMLSARDGEGKQAQDMEVVEELYKLLQSNGARVAPDDAVALDDLRGLPAAYSDAMRRARTWSEEHKPDMLRQLETAEAQLSESLHAEEAKLQSQRDVSATAAEDSAGSVSASALGALHRDVDVHRVEQLQRELQELHDWRYALTGALQLESFAGSTRVVLQLPPQMAI